MNNIHKGGCLCGKSRFETYAKPVANIICHCRYCQLRTGSPFGNILYFDKKDFKFITGNLKTYKFITESGREWKNYFCSNCATIIYCILEVRNDNIGVPGGLFDPPTYKYKISKEVFTRSRANFIQNNFCENSFETSSSYKPLKDDEDRLKG